MNIYLRHRTAPIFTSGQLATSGAIWTCWGSTRTCNISYNRLRCCLLQPRDGCILFVTCTRSNVTCVSVGAAVDTIRATHSLWHRTAPIFTSGQLATSGAIWTCWGSTRTCNISYNRLRCCLLQPRDGCILFVTSTRSDVTRVSVGAAVDTIRATHSLWHRTAPIFTSGQLATSGAIWTCWGSTRTCNISYNRLRCCLLQPRDGCILFVTCTRRYVTCVSIGAAVDTIRATHSLWHRTAPIFTSGQLATSGAIWTCWGSTRTCNISYHRLRCCLLQPRDGCILLVTCTRSNVTCVSLGAAVDTIRATHSLWHRTAPIFTSGQLATSGAIWTCWGSTRTCNISYNRLDGCSFLVTCAMSDVTCVAMWAAVDTIRTAHSLQKQGQIDGLVQERPNSIANILELGLSCTNPWRWNRVQIGHVTLEAFTETPTLVPYL